MSNGRNSTIVSIRLDDQDLEKLTVLADKNHLTVGNYLKSRIKKHLALSVNTTNNQSYSVNTTPEQPFWDGR